MAALCLVVGLAALASAAVGARPVASEDRSATPDLAIRAPLAAPSDVSLPAAEARPQPPAIQAAAPPTVAPAAAPAAPAPRPTADLAGVPPPPDPALPSWGVNRQETGLWSGPTDATLYTKVPEGALFRIMDRQDGRYRVFYPGDRAKRAPGEAWVDQADVTPVAWPRWVRLREPASILTRPTDDGVALASLRQGAFLEVVGEAKGSWARVHHVGDGRSGPVEGWLAVGPVTSIPGPDLISAFALSREALAAGSPEVWLKVPHRSQLDGTRYAEANCGPTTINMVLESFGIRVSQADLRKEVLALQPDEDCDDCGVYLENLAEVVARRGLRVGGLRDDKPDEFHRWTLDEVRHELRAGRPVIAQVFYRGLPARANSGYWGDHYIVLHGMVGDRFIFNDPVDSDGPGYSRLISAKALDFAMSQSDFPYAGFSIGR